MSEGVYSQLEEEVPDIEGDEEVVKP